VSRRSTPRTSLPHAAALPCLALVAVVVTGCRGSGETVSSPGVGSQLRITFSGKAGLPLQPSGVRVAGNLPVSTSIASSDGGQVTLKADPAKADRQAASFPGFDAAVDAPVAAVLIKSRGTDDDLDPGDRDFSYGADVRLDPTSESDEAGSSDNGNNVVQKGLYLDSAQYKLQVDHGFASCRVAGSAGDLSVKSTVAARPDDWYRLTCARTADSLTVSVADLDAEGTETVDKQSVSGATGEVDTATQSTYLSVGAKIDARGVIPASASDQFNGLVRSVFVEIGGRA
jgi:hypothetical protein